MSESSIFLNEIEAFLQRHPMRPATFGSLAVNDGKLLSRLRNGGSVTLVTAGKIRGFMASIDAKAREKAREPAPV